MNFFTRTKAAVAAATFVVALAATGGASAETKVVVGYQQIVGPFVSAIAAGEFDKAVAADGYKIDWRQFASARPTSPWLSRLAMSGSASSARRAPPRRSRAASTPSSSGSSTISASRKR